MEHKQPFSTSEAGTDKFPWELPERRIGGEVRLVKSHLWSNQIWSPIPAGNKARKPFLPTKSTPGIATRWVKEAEGYVLSAVQICVTLMNIAQHCLLTEKQPSDSV